ncbi:MAG: relaxase/mobilization nuclease domain-containing protein [Myxococcales bacterium]|nr:relaxase/mobilization nuclease domain-containing protein [Myxococcales bacterium]NNK43871.1 relaxase/mobilization nuclease domain-containing protein [Myxococcales bacterium]
MIVRHQRSSASGHGFRKLARYIRGQSHAPRATWFLAANLAGVTTAHDVELACRLVEAVQAQNTRAGKDRTYHLVISLHPEDRSLDRRELRRVVEHLVDTLGFSDHQYIAARHNDKDHEHIHVAINKIHPESFRIHSPAWDHQKLFAAGRVLEAELGLRPLRARTRERDELPQPAADYEAQQGVESFARWARETLAPALRAAEIRNWDDVHRTCGRFGVKVRLHGNGLVFQEIEQSIRVKASSVARELRKPRLCERLGDFQRASPNHLEAAQYAAHRYSPMPARVPQTLWKDYAQLLEQGRHDRERRWSEYRELASRERRGLKQKYRQQRRILAALPVSRRDRKRLSQQLALRQAIESRALRRKLANQRKAIQKSPHPGTWRHFVASRAAHRDARAIRLLQRQERQRGAHDLERG